MLHLNINDVPSEKGAGGPDLEPGTYPAVITLIADCGVQRKVKWDSRKKDEGSLTADDYQEKHKLWFSFSFPTERYEVELEGETFQRDIIKGKAFNVSKGKKADLPRMCNALCKKGETIGEMLGMPCTVVYGANDNGTLSILDVSAPMKGTNVAAPIKDLLLVTPEDYDNLEDLDLPDFIKEMIKERTNQ